jgi:hypothetical protein
VPVLLQTATDPPLQDWLSGSHRLAWQRPSPLQLKPSAQSLVLKQLTQ